MKKHISTFGLFLAIILILSSCQSITGSEEDAGEEEQPENQAPEAVTSADPTEVTVGEEVTLDASESSDPDGDELTYEWSLDTPEGSSAELSDTQVEMPTFTPDEDGDYVATVTVDDGNGETDQDNVTVTAESAIIEISGDISSDSTLTSGNMYRVTDAITVKSSATLTIKAGVTVEFAANAGIRVNSDDAALVAAGTKTDSVKLTGVEKSPGFWRGIAFDSNNPSNKLEYTVVEYAGYENWDYIDHAANVSMRGGSNLTLANSTMRHGESFGFYSESNSTLPDFSSNTFTKNSTAAGIPTTLMGALDSGSSFTGNSNDYVVVEMQDISEDMTVSPLDVPYRIEDTPVLKSDPKVTVEAGTTIEFKANAGIRVNSDDAALIVNGADGNPVTFTGVQKSPGFWRGLAFDTSHPDNKLNYAVVEYGGYENWDYINSAANVSLRGGSNLTLTNTTLRHSESFGLYAESNTTLPGFSSNTFTKNSVPAGIPTTLMGAVDSGSNYTGNSGDYVLVEMQDVSEDMTVSPLDVPYRVENTPVIKSDAQVTVDAGVTMEFKANAGIRVNSNDAALIAEGADGNPITFTGVEKSAGFWRGLAFDTSHPNNKLDYVIVEYGGYENWDYINEPANVSMRGGAHLTLTNSTIRHSGGYGGWADDGTSADITYDGNSYSDNAEANNNW